MGGSVEITGTGIIIGVAAIYLTHDDSHWHVMTVSAVFPVHGMYVFPARGNPLSFWFFYEILLASGIFYFWEGGLSRRANPKRAIPLSEELRQFVWSCLRGKQATHDY